MARKRVSKGRVKQARFKRSWFRNTQSPHLGGEQMVEVEFHREGELPSVMARPMSLLGARNTKQGKELKTILADHKQMIKAERKRLKKSITLKDSRKPWQNSANNAPINTSELKDIATFRDSRVLKLMPKVCIQ